MADQIINTLGFNVDEALGALARLDAALQVAGASFTKFGTILAAFNGQATSALQTMRNLASSADRLARASLTLNTPAAAAAPAAAATGSQLWLPPGVQSSAAQLNQTLAKVGQTATQMGQKVAAAGQQGGAALGTTKTQADRLVVSLNTISRVIMTQTIVRVMSMVRDMLKESVTASMDLQKRLAEIQTIAPRTAGLGGIDPANMASLTSEVTEFSKAFNIPLPSAAEGLYQTLSDQFTEVGDRTNVMQAAMRLSKTAVMDFQDAVQLITGTLNAYGMASNEANNLSMKFFETIRLGRVRGKELVDTLGSVYPIAAELGVGIDDVNSAMVAMTIGGIDAHKSMTALRGVMVAFLKPSEAMKASMRELGFSDPSQMIAAKGFQGALQQIADSADGMGSEIAKSVRNVRALTAELRLTSATGSTQYLAALDVMKKSTPEALDQILKEFRSTDAEQFGKQMNALKVNLTQDFGGALVSVLKTLMEFAGGADKVSAGMMAMAGAAVPLGVALVALAGYFVVANIAMGPIGWALAAATVATMAYAGSTTYASVRNIQSIRAEAEARRAATGEHLRGLEELARLAKEADTAAAKKSYGEWEAATATLRRTYFKALDELKEKNSEIINSSRQVTESMISSQERVVAVYRSAANNNVKAVQDSQNRVLSMEAQYADALVNYATKDKPAQERADTYRRRSMQLAQEATSLLSRAKMPDQIQSALALFQRADAAAKEAESIAKTTGDLQLRAEAERTVLRVMQEQLAAEHSLQRLQAQVAQENAAKAAAEQARANEMKALQTSILEDLQAFGKSGAKDPLALAGQEARLRKDVGRFQELAGAGQKVDITTLLGFDQLQRRIEMALEGGVSKAQIRELYSTPEVFANLRDQIEAGLGPIRVLIEQATASDPGLAKEMVGMSAEEKVNHLSQGLQRSQQTGIDYAAMGRALGVAQSALTKFAGSAKTGLDQWAEDAWAANVSMEHASAFTNMRKQPLKEVAQQFVNQASKFTLPGANVNDADFKALNDAYKRYTESIKPTPGQKEMLEQFMRDAAVVLSGSKQAQVLAAGLNNPTMQLNAVQSEQRAAGLERALKAAQEAARQTLQGTEAAKTSAGAAQSNVQAVSQIDLSQLSSGLAQAAQAMWQLAWASQAVQTPTGEVQTAAHGGTMRRFAFGGATGTDVIPALLSPGEMVINAESSRKFASQLVAMNAGIQPVFRSDGGSVTNIGDINVSVHGGGTSRQTARSIAGEIRRELRRGTSTL
jgi:TP901 family phage tail tape measure protein